jgi:hypothetical protein
VLSLAKNPKVPTLNEKLNGAVCLQDSSGDISKPPDNGLTLDLKLVIYGAFTA